MFIKNIISLSLILSFNLIADDHNLKIESDGTVGEFNYVTVTDPINFMMALDEFDKSECGNKWRDESKVNVSLWALRGSGSSTHFILVSYENWDLMEKGRAIFSSCKESADMLVKISNTTDVSKSWNWVTQNVLSGRTWQTNTSFAKFNFQVARGKESEYAKAWKSMMSDQLDNSPGSFGLNAVAYGNRYANHMVYIGANSVSELNDSIAKIRTTKSYKDYTADTLDMISNVSSEMVQFVKFYTGE